jgi:UDP-N-acetylmuramate dehydrogenase
MYKKFPLKNLTTLKVGGPAKWFSTIQNEKDLIEIINFTKKNKIKWRIIGDGTNLVPNDNGFNGLIIKNEIKGFNKVKNKIIVGAGQNLTKFIFKIEQLGLAGMEKMAGIPGTIGGAIYGCAGAYGQEIKNCLTRVKIFNGNKTLWLSKKQCQFGYRESIFKKKNNWIILEAEFKFKKSNPRKLQKISKDIIKIREKKYWPGLLCPGSFFKNVIIKEIKPISLRKKFLVKIPKDKIMFGKVPAGYLLETVDAKGMKIGKIMVANHHGNLIYNKGGGTTRDIKKLSKTLKTKVLKKFGIKLQEEVQYL